MAKVQIYGDSNKGCIFFDGSTVEPKFLGTIIATVKADETDRIVIQRTDRTERDGVTFRKLFRRLKATRIQNQSGENLIADLGYTVAEVATYINNEASNYSAGGAVRPSLDEHPNFVLDATSTTIMVDNGENFGVNTLKAVLGPDGLVDILSADHSGNAIVHYEDCPHENLQINGDFISGGPNDVVNALNELFTVGAFESVVISDPYATMVADVGGVLASGSSVGDNAINPVGDDILASSASHYNKCGWLSSDTIDQAGEYFTFDIRVTDSMGFGLVQVDGDVEHGADSYGDPNRFCDGVANSAHWGYLHSHWFHSGNKGPWTYYGQNTSASIRSGWYSFGTSDERVNYIADAPIKMKVGLDANGYIEISYWDVSESAWQQIQRSSFAVQDGQEFKLGVKIYGTRGRLHTVPKIHLLAPAAPVMYFRYIESPDGYYDYPLFATEAEADYYELTEAGVDNGSHAHVYPDDPANTTWYMPNTSHSMSHGVSPVGQGMTFDGNAINWTEITSLNNADLAPPSFSAYDLTVSEDSSVNYQTQPVDTAYVTTFTNLPAGLVDLGAGMIGGTAPTVADDNVTNPSDSYVIDVVRTNSYGSSTGQLTLIVNNLTAPATVPAGFTLEHGSVNNDGSLASDSVAGIDGGLEVGKRYVVPTSWINANVLSQLDGSLDKAYFGVPASDADWSEVDIHNDFDAVMRWEWTGEYYHKVSLSVGGGPDANHVTIMSSPKASYYHQAIEWDGTDLVVIRTSDLTDLTSRHVSELDASKVYKVEGYTAQSGTLPLVFATKSGGSMLITTSGMQVIDIPSAPATILTPWTKAIDFSGSNERMHQEGGGTQYNNVMNLPTGITVPEHSSDASLTSNDSDARPWATAVVFKPNGNSSNQHIWNHGEGVNGDNIYLRLNSDGHLYFGWGIDGGNNECKIKDDPLNTNRWYGVYVAHRGPRFSSGDATPANLASAFDIYVTDSSTELDTLDGGNRSISSRWVATGNRMNRSVAGNTFIGGRDSNRSFQGKVASMVITNLNLNEAMPSESEVKMMIRDPKQWLIDYKIGSLWRQTGYNFSNSNFQLNDYGCARNTQVWLMGDGTSDAYAVIRNQVYPSDQNFTAVRMVSMVNNDIQNVNINGLS